MQEGGRGGRWGFWDLGRKEIGTHSSGAHKTDQLGDVNEAHGKDGQEGLCVEVRDWIVGFRAIAAGFVLIGL